MNQQIDTSLAGADNGARSVYARPKDKLGELTKHKDLPRSKEDVNQPFYHEHAVLSQAAYDPVKFKSNYQQLGYEIDPELSQPSRTVFYNKSKNKAVIAYKGTDPKHISDLIADGQIFNGMDEYLSGRFRGAEKAYRNTRTNLSLLLARIDTRICFTKPSTASLHCFFCLVARKELG